MGTKKNSTPVYVYFYNNRCFSRLRRRVMKHQNMYKLLAFVVLASMVLAACAPAAAPTAVATPVPPTPSQPTAPPVAAVTYPLKLAAPDCSYGGALKSIEAPDANTFIITTCNPDPAVLAQAAFATFEILPKALLDSTGGDSAKIGAAPIGTGPFILKEWVKGDHMTFVANPNWWGGAVSLKTLIFKWSTQAAQRLLELQSGNVDGIEYVGPEDIPTVQKDTTLSFHPQSPADTLYFGMNNTKPPFDKEAVRQAFAMAIDKQRIVKNFFPAGSTVADQFLYPDLKPGYTDGLAGVEYNPTKAKQMLTDAGFDFNQEILLSFRTNARIYAAVPDQIAQDVQAQLAQIGVKVKLDVQQSSTLIGNSGLGKLTFFLLGWGEDYPDATDWFDYHFGATSKIFGTPYPDIVAAIQQGATSGDPVVRQKAYDTVNQLLLQHVPMVPVAHGVTGDGFKASVKNVVISLYNQNFPFMQTDSGQLVWLQTGEPISLWCGDETDGETINACMVINEPLLKFKYGTTLTEPALATGYDVNADATQYTFHLRQNVKWSDGSAFSAADVFATYSALWNYKDPNHKGNTGVFEYFGGWMGELNAPPPATATPAPAATATP
jgi:ABC-type transport system substrate-binding protein